MKYQIRKVTENQGNIQVEVEYKESYGEIEEGDRFTHTLPANEDWLKKDSKTGNTRLYEQINQIVNEKVAKEKNKKQIKELQKFQNLQFSSN